jgi:hypothetical protein
MPTYPTWFIEVQHMLAEVERAGEEFKRRYLKLKPEERSEPTGRRYTYEPQANAYAAFIAASPYLSSISTQVAEIVTPHLSKLEYGDLRRSDSHYGETPAFVNQYFHQIEWNFSTEKSGDGSTGLVGFALSWDTNLFCWRDIAGPDKQQIPETTSASLDETIAAFRKNIEAIPAIRRAHHEDWVNTARAKGEYLGVPTPTPDEFLALITKNYVTHTDAAKGRLISEGELTHIEEYARSSWKR